jgi:hypothetical protein
MHAQGCISHRVLIQSQQPCYPCGVQANKHTYSDVDCAVCAFLHAECSVFRRCGSYRLLFVTNMSKISNIEMQYNIYVIILFILALATAI